MGYLITEIAICLLLAFLLGCVIGWLLKRVGCQREHARLRDELDQARSELTQARTVTEAAGASAAVPLAGAAAPAAVSQAAPAESSAAADQAVAEPQVPEVASYEVEEIEGIGPGYGKRLRGMGLDTTAALLDQCATVDGMAAIAEHVGVEQFAVQKWACMADLLRIPGVRGQYAELMAFSGVDTVQDLAARNPGTLADELATVNAKEHRTEDVPDKDTLSQWIAIAASLPLKLEG